MAITIGLAITGNASVRCLVTPGKAGSVRMLRHLAPGVRVDCLARVAVE